MSAPADPDLNPTDTVLIPARDSTPKRYYHSQDDCANLANRTRKIPYAKAQARELDECPLCRRERVGGPHPNEEYGGSAEVDTCALCGEEIDRYPKHLPCEGDT